MSRLRIYGIARTRAFRAIWVAKELGLEYEHIPIEIGEAGARKADKGAPLLWRDPLELDLESVARDPCVCE